MCGSEEHPWAERVSEALRADLEAQVARVADPEGETRELEKRIARVETSLKGGEQRLVEYRDELAALERDSRSLEKAWGTLDFPGRLDLPLYDGQLPEVLAQLERSLAEEISALRKQRAARNELQKALDDASKARDFLRRELDRLGKALEKQREEVRTLGERRVGLEERMAHSGHRREEAHHFLSEPLVHLVDWRVRLEQEGASFVDDLAKQVAELKENRAAVESAEQALN